MVKLVHVATSLVCMSFLAWPSVPAQADEPRSVFRVKRMPSKDMVLLRRGQRLIGTILNRRIPVSTFFVWTVGIRQSHTAYGFLRTRSLWNMDGVTGFNWTVQPQSL